MAAAVAQSKSCLEATAAPLWQFERPYLLSSEHRFVGELVEPKPQIRVLPHAFRNLLTPQFVASSVRKLDQLSDRWLQVTQKAHEAEPLLDTLGDLRLASIIS